MKNIKYCFFKVQLTFLSIFFGFSNCENRLDPFNPAYLINVIDKLKSGQNIIFTKYGDGEYNCMAGHNGHNCDSDAYHSWLGESLKKSLVSLSRKPNTYIGRWPTSQVYEYCNRIVNQSGATIPWVLYHFVMNDDEFLKHDYMYKFVEFVVNSKQKKILVCNHMNKRLKDFFRADVYFEIPSSNWSFEYSKWKNALEKLVEKDCIILISGGLCSKVLIDDITNIYNLTFIDLGSSFDLLARKQKSRPWAHSYEDELKYYKDLLPETWDKGIFYKFRKYTSTITNNINEQVNKNYTIAKIYLNNKILRFNK